MNSPPLFILCGPRRGSTLLRYILDTHSQIASPGEIGVGELCNSIERVMRWTSGEASLSQSEWEPTPDSIARTREIVDHIMSSYAAREGKRIWCDKTIDNLLHLGLLSKVFPDARFICLHRDSLDVVQSCLECSRNGYMWQLQSYAVRQPDNLVAAMTSAWIEHTTLALDFERQHPERCFRIRYEDLVTTPADCLRPLLAFAGVEWEDGLLAAVFTTHHDHRGGGDPKIRYSGRIESASVGSGRRVRFELIPEPLRRAVDELCVQLSYPALQAGRRLPWTAGGGPPAAGDAAAGDAATGDAAVGEAAVGAEGAGNGAANGAALVEGLRERLRERAELVGALRGSCKLVLQGPGGGEWKLDFTGDVPAVATDGGAADCSVILSVASFQDIIAGRLHPMATFWEGQVTLEGDEQLATRVAQVIHAVIRSAASEA
jgi:protein-tyrosine sulfotransferase